MSPAVRSRVLCAAVALALGWAFFWLGDFRRELFVALTTRTDAPPGPPVRLPVAAGGGLDSTPRLRVVLVDGAGLDTAATMPAWSALCERGLDLRLDVGFPTVSLPVQVALWTGRTQQQTGILYHSGRPVTPPLAAPAIPPQVPGSIAIAESHGYIVQSLGFARAAPPVAKKLPDGWSHRWVLEALIAVTSPARLAFVHVLRIDTAGHRHGKRSQAWRDAAAGADRIVGALVAAAPDARWLVLADHDHIATGGHASEHRAIRIVRACLAGPGVPVGRGGPISIVDLSRAIADSVGVQLATDAPGRPLFAALAAPVGDDDVLPRLPGDRVALALLVLAMGAAATAWALWGLPGSRRALALPWWWIAALLGLVLLETTPTLSTPMIYKPKGLDMAQAMAPGLGLLAVTMVLLARASWTRAAVAQLAVPLAATLAVVIVTGAAPFLWGEPVCPVVPRWTGWMSPLVLSAALASGVAALALLASAALPASGPSAPPGTRRNERAAP